MKLKYYLRGVGIGIIVTTLIFVIALAFTDRGPTRDEIIAQARKLGMVMKDEIGQDDGDAQDDPNDGQTEGQDQGQDRQTFPIASGGDAAAEQVAFTIAPGEHSSSVIQRLFDAGLIDSIEAFNAYLETGDQDSFLQPGEFIIPRGSSYEEVTRILLTKQENR